VCTACLGQNGHWSNERTVAHYKKLAFKILEQFVYTYKIPRQEVPDFEGEMMHQLVKMPASYRTNSAGAYTILKNAAIIWTRRYQKWSKGENDENFNKIPDETKYDDLFERRRLAEQVTKLIATLPEPERICLVFFYGIKNSRPLSPYLIAKKLGVSIGWVEKKIARAQFLLKRQVSESSLKTRGSQCQTR
jgi:RNA polymerase sigma factor (sigma-70 family)